MINNKYNNIRPFVFLKLKKKVIRNYLVTVWNNYNKYYVLYMYIINYI